MVSVGNALRGIPWIGQTAARHRGRALQRAMLPRRQPPTNMQLAGGSLRFARLFHETPACRLSGLLAASDATQQAPAADRLGSRPSDVLPRGGRVLLRET